MLSLLVRRPALARGARRVSFPAVPLRTDQYSVCAQLERYERAHRRAELVRVLVESRSAGGDARGIARRALERIRDCEMKTEVRFPGNVYSAARRDLARPHPFAAERVGFVAARLGTLAD